MRIAGTNIPDNKRADISLSYIYGVGESLARKILTELNITQYLFFYYLTPIILPIELLSSPSYFVKHIAHLILL